MEPLNQNLLHLDRRVGADLVRWKKSGGGQALAKAMTLDPVTLIETVREAGLRGLGGSGFPVWRKWEMVSREAGKPDKYLVVNGNEDEPGTLKDRLLLAETPHQVIEGALIAARAVGANRVIFYINPDLAASLTAMKEALAQWNIENISVTTQVGGVNLPPLQGEGWGGDGVLRGILPPIPLPASPLKGEEICVPTGPE
ncbi:MAG: hypothetical protein Q8O31_01985, partial [Rhodocyclaceae bacterium]|nr:hypothetical protein [Rhodocyclaceae bacterium]